MKKDTSQFDRFEKAVDALLTVRHADLKAKLDQEKAAKKRKKAKKK